MDNRNIRAGRKISLECSYCDQPYIVKTDDGVWLLTVTHGSGPEGAPGEHVTTMRSLDQGASWQDRVDVSSAELPESAYSVLYKTEYGRIYCFYNYNADNTRELIADDPPYKNGIFTRADSQGHFVLKYSDDHGRSWSENWYDIPIRRFEVDRLNPYGGEIMFFWNVGKPLELDGEVYVPLYKIRRYGAGGFCYSEGVLLHCDNINSERDPERLNWETLPDGDIGIRAPQDISIVSEEHSFVALSDGSVFCVFRTTSGHPWCAYSRDRCRSFSAPQPLRYANGRAVKHPRAANFIWKCENGRYLYWFHNHGGRDYRYRNPVFLCAAEEYMADDGVRLRFSQPYPVLYDDNPGVRMSYPDLVEDDGEYYLTETQKDTARVHRIDKSLLDRLFGYFSGNREIDWKHVGDIMPKFPDFTVIDPKSHDYSLISTESSFTLAFSYEFGSKDEIIFSTLAAGAGIELYWNAGLGRLELTAGDGQRLNLFYDDDLLLGQHGTHEVRIVFDGGVRAVYFVTDRVFCDGGESRDFGFTRFDGYLLNINGLAKPSVNRLLDLRYAEGIWLY